MPHDKKDQAACSLNQLYFYLTEECNLKCRHCWIAPKYQESDCQLTFLPTDLFRAIIQQAKPLGLSGVKLTGGEPLLHPDIGDILTYLRNEGLGLVMETNGTLCTPDLATKIGDCGDPFVSVSIDAAEPEIHEYIRGVPGSFRAAVDGVKHLAAAGIRVQIIMSLMVCNRDQITPMIRLAETVGAASLKINLVMPIARGAQLHRLGEALPIQELIGIGHWVENTLALQSPIPVYYDHPAAFRPLSRMFEGTANGCSVCGIKGILGVLADGSYALCGIGANVVELVMGDARTIPLETIWHGNPVLQKLREGLPGNLEGICRDCLMKHICLGACIAQNYYRRRRLWAPFWYCDQAHKADLFPATRLREISSGSSV